MKYEEKVNDRSEFKTDEFGLLDVTNSATNPIKLNLILESFNTKVSRVQANENWGIGDDRETSKTCVAENTDNTLISNDGENKFHIKDCKPEDRDWIESSTDAEIKDYANIISRIVELALKLKQSAFTTPLSQLKTEYEGYLDSYIDMIDFLKTTIRDLIGQDLYTVGLCLIIVGCSLILSISSTILLNVIINISLEMQKKAEQTKVAPFQINSVGQGMAPVY